MGVGWGRGVGGRGLGGISWIVNTLTHTHTYLIWYFHIFKGDSACIWRPLAHVPLLPANGNAGALSLHDEPGESLPCRGTYLCSSCQHKVPTASIANNMQTAHVTYSVDDHYHKLIMNPLQRCHGLTKLSHSSFIPRPYSQLFMWAHTEKMVGGTLIVCSQSKRSQGHRDPGNSLSQWARDKASMQHAGWA